MIRPEEQTKPILNNVAAESGVPNKPLHTKIALRAAREGEHAKQAIMELAEKLNWLAENIIKTLVLAE